ncbi:cadherin-89D isoform X1 [Drosophila pseudoobscura]|uniref:Cadherin-89D isoform X1 n=1 Tax=Drosophila pseudoobscura pseudoobscura TaxID=46245 RepID=A0A6I8VZL2_DROPS|nr:cadherin-89D isoform X1 [Drosophila pseudoobscura]
MAFHLTYHPPACASFCAIWLLSWLFVLGQAAKAGQVQATSGSCAFHTVDGVSAESEGVRFIRLREDAQVGKEILRVQAYPRATAALKGADASGDHKYFNLTEYNATTVVISLARSLERLVDRDVPRNLLKFRILCAGKQDKLEEGSYLSITVYIEDVNDNAPEFLNVPYVVDVDENTSVESIVFEGVQAFDRDKPNTPNSEVHFSMSTVPEQLSADGSPYFALKSPHRPLLILKRELDFDSGIRQFKLPIFAWDRGTPANQANTTITINVRDVDDLPPKFTEGVYRTKINEFFPMTGVPIRIPLYFAPPIMAFDQDSLNATLVYEIISGNERQLFRVNPHNGVMYLQKEIDLEEESLPGNTFVLQLEARQKDNPLKKALARIEVEVLDLNDNVPEFEADFYNISIVENLPTGFSVLQVNAIDRDQGENSEFLYNLVETKEATGAFRIDSRTGWITVRDDRLLDREQRRSIQLNVEALERNPSYLDDKHLKKPGPSRVHVEITLLDTNDNTPKFEHGNLYEFKVPITAPTGYVIGQVAAKDPDDGPNGHLLYELQRPKGSGYIPFRLDNKNGTIFVGGPLRRGRIAVFVEASDQPTNPSERRFSLAVITIEVYATIDDQAIDFVGAPYEFWVGASTPLGTSVGQVRTSLIYDGEDEIMYDLLHTYSEGVPFAIEERSGIITVIRELSEFKRKVYNFEAVANYLFANSTKTLVMSRSSSPLTTVAAPSQSELSDEGVLITNLTIHIVNKPEQKLPLRPVIEEINMNVINFHVEENVVGGIIGQLLYKNGINLVNNELGSFRELPSDVASGSRNITMGSRFRSRNRSRSSKSKRRLPRRLVGDSNVKLRYIIANQQEVVNKISITEDGTLLTLIGLDREQQASYELTVIVEYSTGLVSGAGIYQVNIKVDDVNDNAPKFNALTYVGLINENCAAGTELSMNHAIHIQDADEGVNAEFRVQLQGDYSEEFSIEYVNGSLSGAAGNTSQHKMPPTTGAFNIFNLTDQWNDEFKYQELHTTFMQSNFKLSSGPYFRISYTGKRGLDREKQQLYNLKLIAADSGGLSGYAHLTILVADVNDNAPIFERISVFKDSRLEIREYTTDMEIYFVESSSGMAAPQATAAMMLAPPPYHIPGSPRLHMDRERAVAVGVVGRAKSRRRMVRALTTKCPLFAIYEDTPIGAKLLQLSASDEDFGKNSQLHYELLGEQVERSPGMPLLKVQGVRHFTMDKLSGELSVNFPLAANIEIWLNLSVTDIDGLKDTTCLRFTVMDVNNHAPTFRKSWYSFDTAEGEYKDSVLGQLTAIDMDYGENANITYTLSDLTLPFTIKPASGVLKISGQLDRELHDKYSFQVIATDNAPTVLQRMSSSVDVEVNVLDINDNRPEFIGYDDQTKAVKYWPNVADRTLMLPVYKAYLDRSTQPGTFVRQMTAIDKDNVGNGNGLVLYSIRHQELQAPLFQIDSRDGTITTVSRINGYNDYEHLNVSVIASDVGSPSLSATAVVIVNLQGQAVTDPPKSTPKPEPPANVTIFQHAYYEVKLAENNEAPIEVMRLNLSAGLNPENYRWSLWLEEGLDETDAHPPFEYDAKNMLLYALKPFDREHISRYQLRIRADRLSREARNFARVSYPVVDERIEGLSPNECRILVHISDENDNAPRFRGNGQPIVAVLPQSASFGYPVTRVLATDADEGLNSEIRYRLLNEPTRLFGIDETTGNIRLLGDLPHDEHLYGFDVKATDRMGADDGRSGIVNVFVYIIDESKQVRLVVAGKPVEVERRIEGLMEALSSAIGRDVRVRLLEPHSNALEPATNAYIYAVDPHTNSIMEMEQLQDSLAGLQLDALQLQQQKVDGSKSMPRIIELAEFGQAARPTHASASSFMGGLEFVTVLLLVLISLGALFSACCYLCVRQKRRLWSQRDFAASDAGLTYTIAGIGASSRGQKQRRQRPQRHTQRCSKGSAGSQRPTSAFMPESVCSSAQTQSTATATEKLEQQLHHHHQQQALATQQQHHQYLNEQQRQREYIDVPLPKSIAKAAAAAAAAAGTDANVGAGTGSTPFVLKYNSCQPVNNLNNYETSLFSLHSTGQDSGVEFLSSRELYETSPDSFQHGGSKRITNPEVLCPRHAKAHLELRQQQQQPNTDSSDTYEDSLKTDEPLVAHNCRNGSCEHRQHHHQHPHYQNTRFEKRSCVRHSFSGVKDDLMQSSPQISLRPRGHALRNSMNDLEQRLHNLEQSFQRPLEFSKSNSLF